MIEGGTYWAWYIEPVTGTPLIPLGVYDHPPDPSFAPIKGVRVGGSRAVRLAATVTSTVNEIARFLDSLNPLP